MARGVLKAIARKRGVTVSDIKSELMRTVQKAVNELVEKAGIPRSEKYKFVGARAVALGPVMRKAFEILKKENRLPTEDELVAAVSRTVVKKIKEIFG